MDTFEQDSAAFLEWFRSTEGTRVSDKIRIADLRSQGSGRAVIATQDIHEDEELFAIPKSLVLTPSTSTLAQSLKYALPDDSNPWLPLIVTIIYERLRGAESPWARYLCLLPTAFNTLMFWSDEELAHLKGCEVVNKIGKAGAEAAWRETIIPLMLEHSVQFPIRHQQGSSKIDRLVNLAHQAGSLIMSYAFDILKDDANDAADSHSDAESSLVSDDEEESTYKGMVPFADILNADADRNNAKLFDEDDYLFMKATASIKAGDEIFNDYGPLPRSDLLRMYGYMTPNYAKYDVVELQQPDIVASANNTDQALSDTQKKGLNALDELGLLEDGYLLQSPPMEESNLENAIPAELHMLLRALTCNLGNNTTAQERTITKGIKEGITVQEASLLAAVCTKRLTEYPTTVKEDVALLSNLERYAVTSESMSASPSPYRLKMAFEVRKGEKEILHNTIDLCQKWIVERTIVIKNEAVGAKRKHQGENGRATEKEKLKKKIKT